MGRGRAVSHPWGGQVTPAVPPPFPCRRRTRSLPARTAKLRMPPRTAAKVSSPGQAGPCPAPAGLARPRPRPRRLRPRPRGPPRPRPRPRRLRRLRPPPIRRRPGLLGPAEERAARSWHREGAGPTDRGPQAAALHAREEGPLHGEQPGPPWPVSRVCSCWGGGHRGGAEDECRATASAGAPRGPCGRPTAPQKELAWAPEGMAAWEVVRFASEFPAPRARLPSAPPDLGLCPRWTLLPRCQEHRAPGPGVQFPSSGGGIRSAV